jgi:hypothetical protein
VLPDRRVVFGGAGFGVVRDEVVVGRAFQLHGLAAQGKVVDLRMVEPDECPFAS